MASPVDLEDRPSVQCSTCNGTGIDRARAAVYLVSRQPGDEETRAAAIRCTACGGSGRLPAASPVSAHLTRD